MWYGRCEQFQGLPGICMYYEADSYLTCTDIYSLFTILNSAMLL